MFYKLPQLKTCKGNLAMAWYVEYRVRHPEQDKLFRKKISIPKSLTADQRVSRAETIIREITAKLKAGWTPFEELDRSKTTLSNALDAYIKQKAVFARYQTIRTLKNVIREFTEWLKVKKLVTFPVSMFNRIKAREYADWLMVKGGKGPVTYNKRIKFMRSIFNDFIERGYIEHNPFNAVKTVKQPKPGIKSWKDEDRVKLFNLLKEVDKPMMMYCSFIFYLGIRPSEITHLKPSDFNLKEGFVTISAEAAKNHKTQSITIPAVFVEQLTEFLSNIPKDLYIFSVKMQPGKHRVNAQRYSDRFQQYQKLLGIKNTPYQLKHTAIELLFRTGCSPNEVQTQMRHEDIQTTMIYLAASQKKGVANLALKYPNAFHLN
jgi:integrase